MNWYYKFNLITGFTSRPERVYSGLSGAGCGREIVSLAGDGAGDFSSIFDGMISFDTALEVLSIGVLDGVGHKDRSMFALVLWIWLVLRRNSCPSSVRSRNDRGLPADPITVAFFQLRCDCCNRTWSPINSLFVFDTFAFRS